MVEAPTATEVATFCPLCVSRCGARATVANGTFTLSRDPSHPTGKALCVKGKAAPEITAHPDRLQHPLKRTAPRGASDPGWQRISWEEALDAVADRLRAMARDHGPESVVFSSVSPSTRRSAGRYRTRATLHAAAPSSRASPTRATPS